MPGGWIILAHQRNEDPIVLHAMKLIINDDDDDDSTIEAKNTMVINNFPPASLAATTTTDQRRRLRRRRRQHPPQQQRGHANTQSSKFSFIVVVFLVLSASSSSCCAFSLSSFSTAEGKTIKTHASSSLSSIKSSPKNSGFSSAIIGRLPLVHYLSSSSSSRQRNLHHNMSAVADAPQSSSMPMSSSSSSSSNSFQQRMEKLVRRNNRENNNYNYKNSSSSSGSEVAAMDGTEKYSQYGNYYHASGRSSPPSSSSSNNNNNLKTVHTLQEYKQVLDECRCREDSNEEGKIVVVRFFATWCKVRERQWREGREILSCFLCLRISFRTWRTLIVYYTYCTIPYNERHARPSNHPTIVSPRFIPTWSSSRCPWRMKMPTCTKDLRCRRYLMVISITRGRDWSRNSKFRESIFIIWSKW